MSPPASDGLAPGVTGWPAPPVTLGPGPEYLIIWLGSAQQGNGDWRHYYSIAPGKVVTVTSRPGPGMLPPHEPAHLQYLRSIAAQFPASA